MSLTPLERAIIETVADMDDGAVRVVAWRFGMPARELNASDREETLAWLRSLS